MYKVACGAKCDGGEACLIELDDDTVRHLSAKTWHGVIAAGLKACGYIDGQKIKSVTVEMTKRGRTLFCKKCTSPFVILPVPI